MRQVYARELKIGDVLVNIGEINKITHSTMPIDLKSNRNYYQVYGGDCIYPIIYEASEEVYIKTALNKEIDCHDQVL
jgi:hypothetical protein